MATTVVRCKDCGKRMFEARGEFQFEKGFLCNACRPRPLAEGARERMGHKFRRSTDPEKTVQLWECIQIDETGVIGEFLGSRDAFVHGEVIWKGE